MKILLLLSLSLFSHASILDGCYKTISIDFKEVKKGPLKWRNQSRVEVNNHSSTYKNEDGKYLKIQLLSLFTGYNEKLTSYSYSPIVMFKNLGTKIENSFSYYYEVDTDIFMKQAHYYKPVDHFVNLNIMKVGKRLYGSYLYLSKERNHNRLQDFVLEKENCFPIE